MEFDCFDESYLNQNILESCIKKIYIKIYKLTNKNHNKITINKSIYR